uniref:26S proteasome complex subunit SEM1 n=1 Tax=Bos mutus grunniens TaxID=30521 RepID=A0A8B9WUQ9_BOSMU
MCRVSNGGGRCGEEERGLELSYWPESFRAPGVTMSEKKQPVDLGLLEEDDEFEEFPAEGRPRPLGLVDRDSGLRVEAVRVEGPGRGAPVGSEDRAVGTRGSLLARPFTAGFGAECHDWAGLDEDEDAHVWEDNWDDDNVEDDFSNQLRAELEKHGYKMETS